MAKIEVTCPRCGDVKCRGTDFQLRTWKNTKTYYVFSCPSCHEIVQRRADDRAVRILEEEGATRIAGDLPDEIFELHTGAPLTHDDLIDLHEMLQAPDWFEALVTTSSRRRDPDGLPA